VSDYMSAFGGKADISDAALISPLGRKDIDAKLLSQLAQFIAQ
jgi:hypothetical protein